MTTDNKSTDEQKADVRFAVGADATREALGLTWEEFGIGMWSEAEHAARVARSEYQRGYDTAGADFEANYLHAERADDCSHGDTWFELRAGGDRCPWCVIDELSAFGDPEELSAQLAAARTQLADAEKRIEALAAIPEIDRRVRARHETDRLRDSSVHACDCSAGLARCRAREAAIRQACNNDPLAFTFGYRTFFAESILCILGDETGTDRQPALHGEHDRQWSSNGDTRGRSVAWNTRAGSVGAQDQGSTE